PEQVALLGRPGRVVCERVEEAVEVAEALRELGGGVGERLRRLTGMLEGLLRGAGEGPDLVMDRAHGLAEQRPRRAQRGTQRLGGRDQPPGRRPEREGEPIAALEGAAGLAQRPRQLL